MMPLLEKRTVTFLAGTETQEGWVIARDFTEHELNTVTWLSSGVTPWMRRGSLLLERPNVYTFDGYEERVAWGVWLPDPTTTRREWDFKNGLRTSDIAQLFALDRIARHPDYVAARCCIAFEFAALTLLYVNNELPRLGAARGDLFAHWNSSGHPPRIVGITRQLDAGAIDALRDALTALPDATTCVRWAQWVKNPKQAAVLLTGHRYRGLKRKAGSRWYHVRRFRPDIVSEPINARSDDAAIFELVSSTRCRMPAPNRKEV